MNPNTTQSNNETDLDWDNLEQALAQFEGIMVENGVDTATEDDDCVGGACKI
ncbi:MAG: hypothetical protein Q4B82_00425 [Alysiella sp.]|uniref:hypothetical protein n=1 Tax=Alysiella sp. TaxID=1872483 RepID=UPI0026DADB34|nr:hypothetical protein [Alysiella sp.]MDO4433033.1 hypothetical protein [Alysiella sp.]